MDPPTNNLVVPLLTDLYQVTMVYGYWKTNKHEQNAVFDLYFRKNPFKGEYTVFAGIDECIRLVSNYKVTESDINYLRTLLPPTVEEEFYTYLGEINCNHISIYSVPEGTVVFPLLPLLRLEGPIAILQLLETPLLNLVNFATLITTNAARHRICAGYDKTLIEFGLRRAQGPDGAISASRYSYLGGFDGTSNILAGKLFGIPVSGTHAHAFVCSFTGDEKLPDPFIVDTQGNKVNFIELVFKIREELGFSSTNTSELIAFAAFARAMPNNALLLVDTYETLTSGVLNFLIIALALHRLGYRAKGIRLDSGDLAYLSIQARSEFVKFSEKFGVDYFANFSIVASNDISESTLESLNQQGHKIDVFGIGTNLVTCQSQPALGCVYKLVELEGIPRIKLSQDISKVTLPGKKDIIRLWSSSSQYPLVDLLTCAGEEIKAGDRILCRHPFAEHKRAFISVSKAEPLLQLFWDKGRLAKEPISLKESRDYAIKQVLSIRPDHKRILNPTPYKVSVTECLYKNLHKLWLDSSPVGEL